MADIRRNFSEAKFRDALFNVDVSEGTFGRRTQLHEYPLRDKPYVEDLGRRARLLTVDAFVLGAGYTQRRDALLDAVEKAGPGTLVHPYLGELIVSVIEVKLRESTAEGGLAHFSIQFIESGASTFPNSQANTAGAVATASDAATSAAQAGFVSAHKVSNKPAFVAQASRSVLGSALSAMTAATCSVRVISDQAAALTRDVAAINRDIISLIYSPASVAQALVANLKLLVREVTLGPRDAFNLARVFFRFGSGLPTLSANTASRRQQAVNQVAMVQLVRVAAVSEGARAAGLLSFDSYQDAVAVRDELVDVMDGLMLGADSDALYDALRALSGAVVRDISVRGADLARVVTYTPAITLPALVVANTLYGDATREAEIVTRNRLPHPSFLAGSLPLEVLTDA